jgi:hypothetical protein
MAGWIYRQTDQGGGVWLASRNPSQIHVGNPACLLGVGDREEYLYWPLNWQREEPKHKGDQDPLFKQGEEEHKSALRAALAFSPPVSRRLSFLSFGDSRWEKHSPITAGL